MKKTAAERGRVYCKIYCHCENSSKGVCLPIIFDFEFTKKQATGVSI